MPSGSPVGYVGARGHRPIPTTSDLLYRRAHAERSPKVTGLDWDALAPACVKCGARSNEVSTTDGLCPGCHPRPARRPDPTPAPAVDGERRPRRRGKYVDRARIIALYTAGESVAAIWKDTGHSEATIRHTIRDAGIEKRDDRKRPRDAKPTAENIRRSGIRTELDQLGVTSHDVKAWGLHEGLLHQVQPGLPPRRVLDAYVAAHPREDT